MTIETSDSHLHEHLGLKHIQCKFQVINFCIENLRLGANVNHLADAAVTRLQGELAKDGREPSVSSKKMRGKSLSGDAAVLRSPDKERGI